jgi:hypothetical protein
MNAIRPRNLRTDPRLGPGACLLAARALRDFGDGFVGTVNPSAGSVSVFVPLEHSALRREIHETDEGHHHESAVNLSYK